AALALRCMDGVFLSPNEDEFVGRIAEELEHFMVQGQHRRVLLFPPLSSRLRYLIHRTVDNVDLLSSFSVGEGWRRRTVICHSAVRLPSETSDQKPSSNAPRPQRPPQPWGRGGRGARLWHGGETHGDNSRACVGSGRIKRPPRKKPDKALYVPKAMRRRAEWGEQVVGGTEADSLPSVHNKSPIEAEEQDQSCENTVRAEGSKALCQLQAEDQKSVAAGGEEGSKNSSVSESHSGSCCTDPAGAKPSVVSWPWGMELVRGRRVLVPGQGTEVGLGRIGNETLSDVLIYLSSQIVGHLTVKDISIEKISFDFSSYGDAQLSEGDFGHVTEIYDFSPTLKTEQLLEVFSDFHESGFKIQWVDDTHALGIFSSSSTASQALGRRYPSLKIRPLIHATKQSKIKALQRPNLLHLAKERPQTDTAVAKRLVSRALGLKNKQQDGSGTEVLLPEALDQEE
ncbi:R3H and coiled-coil domain-containing protein 1, partial [Cuculus canorus]